MSYGGLVDAATSSVNIVPRKGVNMAAVVAGERRQGNVVCDLDGVIYRGDTPIEGAGDALRRLEAMGFTLLFVTNNSTRTTEQVAAAVARISGYDASANQVLGSAEAAASMLTPERPATMVVGGVGIIDALRSADIDTTDDPAVAGAVVVGLDTDFTYKRLDAAAHAIRDGARFIATNTDITYPGAGRIHPGAGAIVAAIAAASGTQPVVAGKPHAPIRALIKDRLLPGPVWVVGDRPETDLALARAERWHAALVLSGITTEAKDVPPGFEPDLVVASIVELPGLIDPP
jgi:HAD superfamily hydrolase (TIGR01450 family)